jgi:hypothetical protein
MIKKQLQDTHPDAVILLAEATRMDDHPAVLVVMKWKGLRMTMKYCFVGDLSCQATVATPDQPNYMATANRFIDSLRMAAKTKNDKR